MRAAASAAYLEAVVFHAVFRIDRVSGLWQPLRYTPIWGLLVVRCRMDRVSKIEELSNDKGQIEAGSFVNALIRCLSFDESVEALRRSLEGSTAMRAAALRKICSDIQHGGANCATLISELQEKILHGAPRRRGGYAYCLLEVARASSRNVQNEVQAFLSCSRYVGLRRRGYKLYDPECVQSRELLEQAWKKFHDREAAWLIVKGHPSAALLQDKNNLVNALTEGWQLSRLYLKLAEIDVTHIDDLLELDPISYVYVQVKLKRSVPDDQLNGILSDHIGDERLGLLLWCLGELRHWDLIVTASKRSAENARQRFASYAEAASNGKHGSE